MKNKLLTRPRIKTLLMYSFVLVLLFGSVLPSFTTSGEINSILSSEETSFQNLYKTSDPESNDKDNFPFKLDILTDDDPEAFFPNFLFYSVKIANAMIDYLFDNVSGGFYISSDELWQEFSINKNDKRSYDNAQAILALLKLSEAVINETESEYALEVAEKTANCLITDLYDVQFDGFYTRQSNRLKKPGIQAKAIQALLSLYEKTKNETYQERALDTFDFLNINAWKEDSEKETGYYVYLLSHSGLIASSNSDIYDPYDPESKRVDHNALMGDALLDLYKVELDEKYLTRAKRIYNFFNTTSRNTSTGLFYTGLDSNNEIVDPNTADIFINSLVLEFLAHLYNITEESKYYDDFFSLLNSVLVHFWDINNGGFYATYSFLDPELRDDKKYTERQFYGIRALDEAFKLTDNSLYYNLILDIVEFLNDKLYDQTNEGYYQIVNDDGTPGAEPSWKNKYTVTQSLAIYELSNLWLYSKPGVINGIWSPSTPRADQDAVEILVAAFDSDGISHVVFNHSIDDGPYMPIEMSPHPTFGNMYNFSLGKNPDGTTVNFNIIVNDTEGNLANRGSYFFYYQYDVWAPQVMEIGIDPGVEIPVHEEFSITVSVQDVPVQGDVSSVRMYYHIAGDPEESIALERIDVHLWKVTFPEGFPEIGTYAYKFEAIDFEGNFDYSSTNFIYILGHLETLPMSLVFGVLLFIFIVVPAGLYGFVEFKKKSARKTLKGMRETRFQKRKGKRSKRGTRGTRRT